MNCYILTAFESKVTELNKIAAMKSDWERLELNQQIGCINKMFLGTILSQDNKDRLAKFVRTVNLPEIVVGTVKLIRKDLGNMWEFILIEESTKMPTMVQVDEEGYRHYCEDAQDEAEK